ncbi:hypothetical protein LJR225_000595 [Phenylobacterium sp. LjRoot225]|uniref:hypothetical protein n=1 Tax=Phenylobacterium sp. LjRoot225 TaxID=3342285 RepID=UPI003ED16AB7
MSHPLPLDSVVEATSAFVAGVRAKVPCRLEAKVSSHEGMPLLCAVEAVLAQLLPRAAAQELVWLSGAPQSGAHVLQLQAFGPGNQLLAEAIHEFVT